MNDLISVIVPVYNIEKHLHKCIDSVINQSFKNLEIILVDDGSLDSSGKICDDYAMHDNRIIVIHQKNGGASKAKNSGLDIATGNIIFFVDSDDWIDLNLCENLLYNLQKNKADISTAGVMDEIEENGSYTLIKKTNYGDRDFCEGNKSCIKNFFFRPWAHWGKLYKKEIWDDIRFPIGEINEDEATALAILEKCSRICYTNNSFYHYIKHSSETSVTSARFHKGKLVRCKNCEKNLNFINERYPEFSAFAEQKLISSLVWALNNMTIDIVFFKKEIQSCLVRFKSLKHCEYMYKHQSPKEIFRRWLLMYFYRPYAWTVNKLGKKYT